jgi:hypothetical protein
MKSTSRGFGKVRVRHEDVFKTDARQEQRQRRRLVGHGMFKPTLWIRLISASRKHQSPSKERKFAGMSGNKMGLLSMGVAK